MEGGEQLLEQPSTSESEYDRRCETSEAIIYIAMIRLMVRRLAHSAQLALQAA